MNQLLHLFCLLTLTPFYLNAQTPIDIVENTLKISALGGGEVFYFGFAEGDQLIFNLEEVNGKELKEVEIIELPSSSRFMDYKTKKVTNKVIHIPRTGIYKFRLQNSAVGGRVCKVKIQRVPASEETVRFNSSVHWKKIYDSSYTTIQEKYLIKQEYTPVAIVPTSEFYINSGSNAAFKGGKSRITIPVKLPTNTVEWYYVFSSNREKADTDKAKSSFNLVSQLSSLIDQTGVLNIGVDMLTNPPGGNICDVYLLNFENKQTFESKASFNHFSVGTRENINSGISKINFGAGQTFFLGIKNPDSYYGIQVAIEVVAITLKEEWGIKDVQKLNVTSRDVPFLLN